MILLVPPLYLYDLDALTIISLFNSFSSNLKEEKKKYKKKRKNHAIIGPPKSLKNSFRKRILDKENLSMYCKNLKKWKDSMMPSL